MRPMRLLPALLAALALGVVLASCGGGDTGSTAPQAATASKAATGKAQRRSSRTYLPAATSGRRLVEPRTYRFSIDGNLIARGLEWHRWGKARAVAFGRIVERPASGLVDTFAGRVTATAPRACNGARYYTEVMAHPPKQADYVPTEPTRLATPCD